jgi:hypothetical protein
LGLIAPHLRPLYSARIDSNLRDVSHMTNVQVRIIASSIALIAGAIAASTDNLEVSVGLVIILLSGAMFVSDYVRSQRQ